MTSFVNDTKYAFRMLYKKPGFTAIALLTLAIGIGANTIMFSVVNVMLLRPIQVKEPDRLVACAAQNGFFTYEVFQDARNDMAPFSDVMALGPDLKPVSLAQGNIAKRATSTFVSANYFSFLGVTPTKGRGFLPAEERHGAEPVVVLSHRTWQREGGYSDIIGREMIINGTAFRIVGIAPKGFTGTALIGPDLWLPLGTYGLVGHEGRESSKKRTIDLWNYPMLSLIGRLKPGLDMAVAEAQLQPCVSRLKETFPRVWREDATINLQGLSRVLTDPGVNDRAGLYVASAFLMTVSAVVLLIACLNLGNMLIVQGAARHREIAIRMAIGGGRWRIVGQLLCESLLLALLGGACGCVLAFWGTRVISTSLVTPQVPELGGVPRIGLDLRVLGGTLGFCLIATVLFGLRPALRLSKRNVMADMKESSRQVSRTGRKRRFVPRGLSVVGQIALSVVLVMGASLFTRSAVYTTSLDPGFDLKGKLLAEVDPLAGGYDRLDSVRAVETLADRLVALPGIETTALSTEFPFAGGGRYGTEIVEYQPSAQDEEARPRRGHRPVYTEYHIAGDFFNAMEIPLLQGRSFNRLDRTAEAEKVVIIGQQLANKLRPGGNALGCLVQFGTFSLSSPHRVVGIVGQVRSGVSNNLYQQIYLPIGADELPTYIHLRATDGHPRRGLSKAVAAEIHRIDPLLPVVSVKTLAQRHRTNPEVWAAGSGAKLAVAFGTMALFLASLGIYAIKGYMVTSRRPEIGIRKALGATHKDIMSMVLREGSVLTLVGLALGLLLGFAVARLIAGLLYGIKSIDPISVAVTVVLLLGVSLLAGYLPARRAARIDPMEALRYE